MKDDRKKSTAGFRIKVSLLAVLAAYPLSFGPACWITSRADRGLGLLPIVYWPILKSMSWQEAHDLASRPPEGDNWEKGASSASLRHSLFSSWYAGGWGERRSTLVLYGEVRKKPRSSGP